MAHDVFISYSHRDKAVADAMCFALEESGIRCWYAPRDIAPGKTWADAIVEAIAESRVLVLIFTDFSNKSDQVVREIDQAIQNGVSIVPFKLTEAAPHGGLSYYLSTVHWLDSLSAPLETSLANLVGMTAALLETGDDGQTEQRLRAKYKGKLVYREQQRLLGFRSGKWYFKLLTGVYFALLVAVATLTLMYFAISESDWRILAVGGLLLACLAAPYVVVSVFPARSRVWQRLVVIAAIEAALIIGLVQIESNVFPANPVNGAGSQTAQQVMDAVDFNYGNTAANLLAGGYAVKSGQDLYFIDKSRYNAVTRLDLDTLKLDNPDTSQRCQALNAVGNIVYYCSDTTVGGNVCYLFTLRGQESGDMGLSEERLSRFMIVNNVITFIDDSDGNIYCMDIDTSGKTLITNPGGKADKLSVNKNYVYYLLTDKNELCRVGFDGSDNTVIASDVIDYSMDGDSLYLRMKDTAQVVKTDLTGQNESSVISNVSGDFIAADGKLFYKNADDNNYLYSADTNSDTQKLLYKATYDHIAAIDGYLYCFSETGAIFRIKTDGADYTSIIG